MKKRNLLSLSALVLSLGLVVTSCATQGTEGPEGKPGEQGPAGPEGKPGNDGKTFVPVIVVNDSDIVGGEIGQDKYWIEIGGDETVKFTFTPDEETDDLIVNFEINGEPVAVEADAKEFTYTLEEGIGTVQVTRAEFTNATKYAEDQLYEFYNSLAENDSQLDAKEKNDSGEWVSVEDQVKGQWFSKSSDVLKAVTDQLKTINSAVAALDTNKEDDVTPTGSEKLAKINELLPAAETAIQTAYNTVLTTVKTEAKEALEDISDIDSENFKDTDKAAILTQANAEIDAATTIAGVTNLINNVEVENELETGVYNRLYSRKDEAFKAIESALETAYDDVPELEDTTSPDYEELETTLATWDITLSDVSPDAIAEEYLTKVSAAKTLEEIPVYTEDSAEDAEMAYSEGDVVLGVEGAYAVSSSVDGLEDTLVENIRKSYEAEVDNSKVITSTTSRDAIKGLINNAIDTWLKEPKDDTSTDTNEDLGLAHIAKNLPSHIESLISDKDAPNYNAPWQAERLQNALASVKTEFASLVAAEKTDSHYASLIKGTKVTNGTTTTFKGVNLKVGPVSTNPSYDYRVDNFAYTGVAADSTTSNTNDGTATGLVQLQGADQISVGNGLKSTTYSVDAWYETLFPQTGNASDLITLMNQDGVNGPVEAVRMWSELHRDDFKIIHNKATAKYLELQEEELRLDDIDVTSGAGDNAIIKAAWDEMFGDQEENPYGMSDVSNSVVGIRNADTLLFAEGTGLVRRQDAFLREIAIKDKDYNVSVYEPEISELRKQYEALIQSVIAGTTDASDVANFADDMEDLYTSDVEAYKSQATKDFQEAVAAKKETRPTEVAQNRLMEERLAEAIDFLGTEEIAYNGESYNGNTITSINAWLHDANLYVLGDSTQNSVPSGSMGVDSTTETVAELRKRLNTAVTNLDSYVDEFDSEKSKWTLANPETDVTKVVADSYATTHNLVASLKLKGTVTEHGLSYDLTTKEGVNNWFEDLLKVKGAIESAFGNIYTSRDEMMNSLVGLIEALDGNTTLTDANVSTINNQLKTALSKYFTGSFDNLVTYDSEGDKVVVNDIDWTTWVWSVVSDNLIATVGGEKYDLTKSDELSAFADLIETDIENALKVSA